MVIPADFTTRLEIKVAEQLQSQRVGYLVDVQGDALTATLVEDEQGHSPIITIGDEDILVGQIGSYVAVRQGGIHIIAMVTRMTEQEVLAASNLVGQRWLKTERK